MPLTLEQISEYLQKAADQASQTSKEVSDKKIGEKIADEIYAQTDAIQTFVNGLLGKAGLITQEELDQLDLQLRLQKEKLLQAESKKTTRNIITISLVAVAAFGALWFITKKN